MPKWNCMYAYSVSRYSPTIVVEANTELEAQDKMQEALKDGRFEDIECETDYDVSDQRVFTFGQAEADAKVDDLNNLQ